MTDQRQAEAVVEGLRERPWRCVTEIRRAFVYHLDCGHVLHVLDEEAAMRWYGKDGRYLPSAQCPECEI